MNKRKCIILKEAHYMCNDKIINEIEKKITYLIKRRNINKFYIEDDDLLSKMAIKSVDNKAIIHKLIKKENYSFSSKLREYKSIAKNCEYIIIIGCEFYESNLIKYYINLTFENTRYFFIDKHYFNITNSIRFE